MTEQQNSDRQEVSPAQKAKGAAQMAAGAGIAAAGVPMLILPGPGAVAIVGGAALASKGQRTFSGRKAHPLEEKLDAAAAKATAVAKEQAQAGAAKVGEAAPQVVKAAAQVGGAGLHATAKAAGRVAAGVAKAAREARR